MKSGGLVDTENSQGGWEPSVKVLSKRSEIAGVVFQKCVNAIGRLGMNGASALSVVVRVACENDQDLCRATDHLRCTCRAIIYLAVYLTCSRSMRSPKDRDCRT